MPVILRNVRNPAAGLGNVDFGIVSFSHSTDATELPIFVSY